MTSLRARPTPVKWLWVIALALSTAVVAFPNESRAQEILLTGPLKGAGSVHRLRLYRKQRLEFAPTATFTLLDEYLRQIFVGARLNYNITDFLAIGAWGGFSPEALQLKAGLVDKIQGQTNSRRADNQNLAGMNRQASLASRLTALNLSNNFEEQLGSIDWIVAPQLTFVPFRGKIALFQSIYVDSDLYFFAGPAFVGVNERQDCTGVGSVQSGGCSSETPDPQGRMTPATADGPGDPIVVPNSVAFPMKSRMAIAPTFGLGFTFYVNRWNAFGFEWRATPFSRNTSGFDNHGGGPDSDFPDSNVDADDRDFKINQMLSISWNFYIPLDYQTTE
jgi:hypothetical protein